MNTNIQGDLQICFSVPLKMKLVLKCLKSWINVWLMFEPKLPICLHPIEEFRNL